VWVPAVTPGNDLRRGAQVTEITGLLTLAEGWPPDLRVLARTEPLHPRHRKQASEVEKQRGQRFQATATDLPGHHYPYLDAFHRNHAGVEAVIKDGEDLGLRRLPSHSFAFNQAWCTLVAIAADLLAWLRHLALDHHPTLSKATPATLRRTLLHVPARLVHRARKRAPSEHHAIHIDVPSRRSMRPSNPASWGHRFGRCDRASWFAAVGDGEPWAELGGKFAGQLLAPRVEGVLRCGVGEA
jgi:Transposase DDE domain group 1